MPILKGVVRDEKETANITVYISRQIWWQYKTLVPGNQHNDSNEAYTEKATVYKVY